jgi:hypothetical protein
LGTLCQILSRDLNCSGSFLAKERMRGTGPEFIRIGRAVRYSRSALDVFGSATN